MPAAKQLSLVQIGSESDLQKFNGARGVWPLLASRFESLTDENSKELGSRVAALINGVTKEEFVMIASNYSDKGIQEELGATNVTVENPEESSVLMEKFF